MGKFLTYEEALATRCIVCNGEQDDEYYVCSGCRKTIDRIYRQGVVAEEG